MARAKGDAGRSAPPTSAIERRVARVDWSRVRADLDASGSARLPRLLTSREAATLRRDFDTPTLFRRSVDMERHAYGAGDYRYYAAPLPPLVEGLRRALYPPLASIARTWATHTGDAQLYPDSLEAYRAQCAAAGQRQPTPLLLRYGEGGYNRMHQDRYGELVFPLQVLCLLSRPSHGPGPALDEGTDFRGGQVLISEHRARMQTRVDAISLDLGDGLVFAASERPVPSKRGHARATMRHGVATVHAGERMTLGIIFHDAES